jgi:CheY-like chemotaxis protein
MSFTLHRRPGSVVFLDDDPDYLEMLAEVMPLAWHVRLFMSPVDCIAQLMQEPPTWEADGWRQQEIVNRWQSGTPLIPQILQYWREDQTARFAFTKVCVVDYAMPAMSGLQVLSEIAGWTGSRILLTGRIEEQLAVSAFNRGLIERFVPKQASDIRLRLTGAIQELLDRPDAGHEQTWRSTLSREQHALLCDPAIARQLDEMVRSQGWIEHIVIGAPFGVLALDSHGLVSWLQLEPAQNLPEVAEMAESQGWNAAMVEDIRAGKTLLDLELQLALGANRKPEPQAAFCIAGTADKVYAALFKIDESMGPEPDHSHASFIAGCDPREIENQERRLDF